MNGSRTPPQDGGVSERRAIVGRAGIVGAGTLTSRLLGLGREQVLAGMFTRSETDSFIIAFTLPNLLRQVLAEGAMQTGVLPVLAATRQREGDARAQEVFRKLRALSWLLLLPVCVLGVWFAPWLVELAAGGFKQHPGQFERTVTLTRWVFPYIFFMGTAALGLAALNTYGRYLVTAFAPALLNVSFIVCGLCLPVAMVSRGHDRTLALAIGVWIGGVLQVIAQWPSLRAIGMTQRPTLDWSDPAIREVFRRLAPAFIGIGVYYVDVFIARHLLSQLEVGATSYFTFALRLCDFPQGIFIMALQAATLPSLSRLAAQRDHRQVGATVSFGLRLSLFVAVPATVLMVILAEPLVVLIFQRGHFDALAAKETARALVAQGLGIWMVACVRQMLGGFYALGDTKTPALIAGVDLLVFITLALSLQGSLGHVGIGLAVTAARLTQLLLVWWLLQARHSITVETGRVLRSAGHTLLACGPAAVAGWWASKQASGPDTGALARALPGLAGAGVFGAVFLLTAYLSKHRELVALLQATRRAKR